MFTSCLFMIEILYIIGYVYTYTCNENINQEEVDAFNNANSTGDIGQFITENGTLEIPCGVTKIDQQIKIYENKTDIINVEIPDSVTIIVYKAFDNCSGLQSAVIPNSVTIIEQMAFLNCTSLSTVNIPTKLTTLYGGIFFNCTSLKEITIPNNINESRTVQINYNWYGPFSYSGLKEVIFEKGITVIGSYMFYKCENLTSIIIPESVTEIGEHAFQYCKKLVTVDILNGTTIIGEYAFSSCLELSSIVIPDSVISIKNGAFSSCSNLESINIPNGVTYIGVKTFSYCSSLQSIIISSSATEIKKYAFQYCRNLTSIKISDNVTEIEEYAFLNCTSLQSINIPNSVTEIGQYAFLNCTSLSTVNIPTELKTLEGGIFTNCTSLKEITIPGNIKEIKYQQIRQGNYYNYYGPFTDSGLQEVTIEKGIAVIGKHAFENCRSLLSIIIPNSVTEIGEKAFDYCTRLKSITIPNSVTSIEDGAFIYCWNLQSITIPDSVISIGVGAFEYCYNLQSITMSNSVTSIGGWTFCDCRNLQSINIPDSITYIAEGTFSDCKSLQSIIIPSSVTHIRDRAFQNCKNLQSIIISNSVTSIGNSTFYGCSSLQSIIIPDNVMEVGKAVFYNCTSLQSIIIPGNVTKIEEYAFEYCENLTSVAIQYGVTKIRENAFHNCTSLIQIVIPDSVTEIEEYAFHNCRSLQSIIIPNSVKYIENYAFLGCENLSCVQISSDSCIIKSMAFGNTIYQGKRNLSDFNQTCEINIYTECQNDSLDYHDPNSDKCVLEAFVNHYIIQDDTKYYQEQCPDTHQLIVQGSKQCFSECPQYYEQQDDNKCILNSCLIPDNFYLDEYDSNFKDCVEKCYNIWHYYQVNDKSVKICLTNKDNCNSVEGLKKQAEQQCVFKCSDADEYIQPKDTSVNICVTKCIENDIQYVYYDDGTNGNICTDQTTCKLLGDQYKLYDSNTKECRTSCGNNSDDPVIFYVWYQTTGNDNDNICTTQTKCSDITGQVYKLVKDTTNNQCTTICGTDKVWYNDETDNKCSDQTDCGIAEQDVANYGKMIESTKQCVVTCAKVDYYYPQGATDKKCVQNCQTTVEGTTNQVPAVWYSLESEKICTSQIVCSSEQVKYGEGENQKVLKFRESQNSQQCIESCGENNVWFVFENYNQKENMCTQSQKCELTGLTGYENLNKNQNQQCVSNCLGKDDDGKEINYVYYYESDQKGNMCTELTVCDIEDHESLNKNQKQQCVNECKGVDGEGKQIGLVWRATENQGNVCDTVSTCKTENPVEYIVINTLQCVEKCPQYYDIDKDVKQCLPNPCLNPASFYEDEYDAYFKECKETCDNVWYYYKFQNQQNDIKVCLSSSKDCTILNDKKIQFGNQCIENCISTNNTKFIKSNTNLCVEKCEQNEFIQDTDNRCLTSCSKDSDKQLYQYQNDQAINTFCTEKSCQQLSTDTTKYYIYEMTDSQIYCTLSCNNSKFNDKPYIFTSDNQEKCVSQCLDGYKPNDKQTCIQEQKQNDNDNNDNNRLKSGQIAGIVVGAVAAVAIIIVLVLYFIKKRKQSTTKIEAKQISPNNIDQTTFDNNDTNQIMQLEQQNNQQILQPVNINIASESYNQQPQQQLDQQQPTNNIDQQQTINQQALDQDYVQQTISNINNYQ